MREFATMDDYVSMPIIDQTEEDGLRKRIIQILLEDPDSEVKRLAENYLIQCLYEAVNDPENNPILKKFFEGIKNEIGTIKSELLELKHWLGYSYDGSTGRVAFKHDINRLEERLNTIIDTLEKAGIPINSWEN